MVITQPGVYKLVRHQRERRRRDDANQIGKQTAIETHNSLFPIDRFHASLVLPYLYRAVHDVLIRRLRIQLLKSRTKHLKRIRDHRRTELGHSAAPQSCFVVLSVRDSTHNHNAVPIFRLDHL